MRKAPKLAQPLRKFWGFFCKKNTKTGRMLLHNMVNHIRGRLTSITSIKMLKSAEIQNGHQKYIHQAKTCGIIDVGRLIHNTQYILLKCSNYQQIQNGRQNNVLASLQ